MSFYRYSVGKLLFDSFGDNTVTNMRSNLSVSDAESLCWQYADLMVTQSLKEKEYLIDTIIEDDYIAYISQSGTQTRVYLLFMFRGIYFNISPTYAEEILSKWGALGYKPYIISVCVPQDTCKSTHPLALPPYSVDGGFFKEHSPSGTDARLYEVLPCWNYYLRS